MTSIVVLLVTRLASLPRDPGSIPDNGDITNDHRDVACIKYLVIKRLKSSTRYYNLHLRNTVLYIIQTESTH